MGLFSNKAAVNLDEVTKFRERVENFSQISYEVGTDMLDTLEEMEAFAEQRAQEMEQIAHSYDNLYSSIQQLKHDVEQNLSSLKAELSRTPKELEKIVTDDNGKEAIKKIANPAYAELEARIQKENSRLAQIKDLSWNVYNEVSHSHRVADELASSAYEIQKTIPEIQSNANKLVSKSQDALCSLEQSIRAINNYLLFRFHI